MAKGWKRIDTVNDMIYTPVKDRRKAENLIRNTKSKTAYELKKEAETAYNNKILSEEKLMLAYKNNLLKSEDAIKEAKRLIKAKEKEQKKEEKKN